MYRSGATLLCVLLCLYRLLHVVSTQAMESDVFDEPATCASNEDCNVHGMFAHCMETSVTNADGSTGIVHKCRCDGDAGQYKRNDQCMYFATIGEVCDDTTSHCAIENSQCEIVDPQTRQRQCTCTSGRVETEHQGVKYCGTVLALDTAICKECQDNEGACVDIDDNGSQDTCACPGHRSGDSCQNNHMNVSCDYDNYTMTICYNSAKDFPEETTPLDYYISGYQQDSSCQGHHVEDTSISICVEGDYELNLDIRRRDDGTFKCGTTHKLTGFGKMEYYNIITVSTAAHATKHFASYCRHLTEQSTGGHYGVVGLPGNNRGQYVQPSIVARVQYPSGIDVVDGTPIRLGDEIRMEITISDEIGYYTAMLVESCIASSSGVEPDHGATTMLLIRESCPASGQMVIKEHNMFKETNQGATQVRTGNIRSFSLRDSKVVYIHCLVKVCLLGMEEDCLKPQCPASGSSRKRREATSGLEEQVTARLQYYNPEEYYYTGGESVIVMNTLSFTVMMCMLVLIILIFLLISARLFWLRLQGAPGELKEVPPMRFAMPRIAKSSQRI